jgi:L-ascorbate metabolism protein UlaG (beta-lactamase superfamily)
MRVAHLRRHTAAPVVPAGVDFVLLSHLHRDHADGASLRALGAGTRVVAPKGAGPALRRLGISPTHLLAAGDAVALSPQVTVHAVAAHHDGRRHPLGRPIAALGYVLETSRQRIYFAGDTELFAGMAQLAEPPLDVALLPIWGWGHTLGAGHLDPEGAVRAVALLAPRIVVPIHWGTFLPIGTRHRWALVDPVDEFLDRMRATGVRVAAMAPGGVLDLADGTTRGG